ncbi:ATP-binding protein [Collinsella sp. AGMB00827]|uniref:histidine kinase n=1 Tax=Collinsella ureilytica TaxID=2869515 RepID=A0ABS7MKA8_9ACTN|nr:ATP-binding protein [Collinsella urealyticum]MBY4797801.1 ATP-binding protein [Collinsella urealyticum]
MTDTFYPFVDSGDPVPDNSHLKSLAVQQGTERAIEVNYDKHVNEGTDQDSDLVSHLATEATSGADGSNQSEQHELKTAEQVRYATRIAVYDDMLSTPRVIIIEPRDVRSYLEDVTNTVYRCMREQGGRISLMVIREIVENFIHAHFVEPIISVLDDGNTVRFADQGPGIADKERAFEFGITSADREQKRYIRGTGAGFPMVQQYLENAGGAISIEDNLGKGTVVTVTIDPARKDQVTQAGGRGAAVRGDHTHTAVTASPTDISNTNHQTPAHVYGTTSPDTPYSPTQVVYPEQTTYPETAPAAPSWVPPTPPNQSQVPPRTIWDPITQRWYTHNVQAPPSSAPIMYHGSYGTPYSYPAPYEVPAHAVSPTITEPQISERGMAALQFLATHTTAGPTELTAALGLSNATWSRELEALTKAGLVLKSGQKRILTEMGKIWIEQHAGR